MRRLGAALLGLSGIAGAAAPASAEVVVRFTESAPKDLFEIRNAGQCEIGPVRVSIDLSGSVAGLIFDTTGSGAGVSVYQPFELYLGAEKVQKVSEVSDGFTAVTLHLTGLEPGESVGFTIDVDDTLKNSSRGQTMIDGSEIAGASVSLEQEIAGSSTGVPIQADFATSSIATVPFSTCLS